MAYPALSTTIASQRPAAIRRIFIKTGSEKWQSLGLIRNAELKVTPYTTNNTYMKNLSIQSYLFETKAELLQTSTSELELLDSIMDGSNSFLFQLTDAGAISTGATEGWVTVSNTQIGVAAKFITDTDPSKGQYIELNIKGTLKGSELDAALKASIATADFHISTTASETYSNNSGSIGGTIFGYYVSATAGDVIGIQGNIKPSGFSSLALDDHIASGALTLGRTTKGKMTIEWLAEEDSLLRPNTYGVDINAEYEYMTSDAASLLLLDSINITNTDVVLTLLDGKVFTFTNQLGVEVTFENVGDFNSNRKMKFTHKGRVLKSDFDGIVA